MSPEQDEEESDILTVIYKEASKDKAIVEIELNNVTAFISVDSVLELVEVISGDVCIFMYIYVYICVYIYVYVYLPI
jgi:hypothetical protein